MRFDAGLSGEAAALAREYQPLLARLPASFQASVLLELQRWPLLFPPEKAYQRALLAQLAPRSGPELTEAFAGIRRVELEAGSAEVMAPDPRRFQEALQARLRQRGLLPRWRREVEGLFGSLQPALDSQLHPAASPRRLVVLLYGKGIAIQPDKLWQRLRGRGRRVRLRIEGVEAGEAFLRGLFGGAEAGQETLFSSIREGGASPYDAWLIEAGDALHALCEAKAGKIEGEGGVTGLSYERLRGYREELTRALFRKVQSGVSGPQEFAAYARSLEVPAPVGLTLHRDPVLQAFVRDVFLGGNGALVLNNTFVEWAAVQALKRAQPRLLVVRFGVRDKLKPFTSLLLFSQPRATDQIPILEDPLGSFVDVELLSYYVWLNAEKSPAYRNKTLYLLLVEGFDEMLAIRSDLAEPALPELPAASLGDVRAGMAEWLGTRPRSPQGPLAGLLG